MTHNIYLNHASIAPLQPPVKAAILDIMTKQETGTFVYSPYMQETTAHIKSLAGNLIACPPTHVSIQPNTATSISIFIHGLSWEPGDHILAVENDFPSVTLAALNIEAKHNVTVSFIPEDEFIENPIESVSKRLKPQTKLFLTSLVGYMNGLRFPVENLAKICHQNKTLIGVDGTQGIGIVPFNFKTSGIDFLAFSAYKWLMCPLGTAFIAITDALLHELTMTNVGWQTQAEPKNMNERALDPSPYATKFESGGKPIYSLAGTKAALEYLSDVRWETVSKNTLTQAQKLIDGLEKNWNVRQSKNAYTPQQKGGSSLSANIRNNSATAENSGTMKTNIIPHADCSPSGIVTIHAPNQSEALFEHLANHNIQTTQRLGQVRLAPHFYTTDEQIEKTLNTIHMFRGN